MDIISWLFFGPAKLMAIWPLAGVVIAAILIALQVAAQLRTRQPFGLATFRKAPVFAGLLWLIFNGYEAQMAVLAARDGGNLFRLDLMVLVPILYVLTAVAALSIVRQWQAGRGE